MLPIRLTLLWILTGPARAEMNFEPILPASSGKALSPLRAEDFPIILERVSRALFGRAYQLGPLGEGTDPAHPLYRLDAFDCTTFLETVMANAYCYRDNKPTCLRDRMQRIRYAGNRITFAERNHIPELDWLPGNVARGYLLDLHRDLFPEAWKGAHPTIDRALWLADHGVKSRTKTESPVLAYLPVAYFFEKALLSPAEAATMDQQRAEAQAKIEAARAAGADAHELEKLRFRAELASLRAKYKPVEDRLAAIPSGTVLNLVRAPEKNPAKAKRTPLVSHQGLVLQTREGPRIRHASPGAKRVSDQSLADYLLRYVESAHYRGISLFKILPSP